MSSRQRFAVTMMLLAAGFGWRPGARLVAGESDAPILEIVDATYSWGKAFKGQQLEHTFVLRNAGKKPLVIEALKPNCGCMVPPDASAHARPIGPGESLRLTLHIDTSILAAGKIENKHTEVVSNAASGENLLNVEGEIEELFTIDPPFPRIDVVRAHTEDKQFGAVLDLEATAGRKVTLEPFKAAAQLVTSELEEVESGTRFRLRMKAHTSSRDAFQKETLGTEVTVNGETLPFVIPVTIILKERIDVTPSPSVFFPRKATGALADASHAPIERELEIVSIGGAKHRFEVLEATTQSERFEARVAPILQGKSYRLTVLLKKGPAEGERVVKDAVEVVTDDPEVPTITIRISAQF